jgi:hypothetical protein
MVEYEMSSLEDAETAMTARDLRRLLRASAGVPRRFVWAVLCAARGRESKPRLAASLLHDGGYRTTTILHRGQLGLVAMLRLIMESAAMFPRDPDGSLDALRVYCGDALPRRLAPTAALPVYVSADGKVVAILRSRRADATSTILSSSTVVTALLAARGEVVCPTDAQAMRTVMTTTVRPDHTLVVRFWPPVGAWLRGYLDADTELHVWHGGRRGVDLMMPAEGVSVATYPRVCKMHRHAAGLPVTVAMRRGDIPGWSFEAVAEVSVTPGWSDGTYRDESDSVLRLGRAKEVARRHDAACVIQTAWREAVSSPDRLACRRRLHREFEAM